MWLFCIGMMGWVELLVGRDHAAPSARIEVAPGPYYVGQGIAIELKVDDATGEPAVEPPRSTGAELVPLGAIAGAKPGDGPGRTWAWRFVLIPSHAGELKLGSFRVRDAAGRVDLTKARPLAIRAIPQAGRSARFLGGVGGCRAVAAVERPQVRQGQAVEFRITLDGPGAWGSVQAPDLAAWPSLPAGVEVQAIGNQLEPGEAPSRIFRYRLRPRRAGRLVLPPVAVATFDPGSGRFETRATVGVPLVVEPPPRFDPATIELDPPTPATLPGSFTWIAIIAGTMGTLVGMTYALLRRGRTRRRTDRPVSWRREAADLRRWAVREWRGLEVADEIDHRLTRAIRRATRQPIAVLTPTEAATAVASLTGDADLTGRVQELVARVDRLRFDEEAHANATVAEVEKLVGEAVEVFRAIGRSVRPSRPDRPTSPHPTSGDAG